MSELYQYAVLENSPDGEPSRIVVEPAHGVFKSTKAAELFALRQIPGDCTDADRLEVLVKPMFPG
jgi:hypothetical protein